MKHVSSRQMRISIALGTLLLVLSGRVCGDEFVKWRTLDGKEIEAEYVSHEWNKEKATNFITVRTKAGKQHVLTSKELDDGTKRYLNQLLRDRKDREKKLVKDRDDQRVRELEARRKATSERIEQEIERASQGAPESLPSSKESSATKRVQSPALTKVESACVSRCVRAVGGNNGERSEAARTFAEAYLRKYIDADWATEVMKGFYETEFILRWSQEKDFKFNDWPASRRGVVLEVLGMLGNERIFVGSTIEQAANSARSRLLAGLTAQEVADTFDHTPEARGWRRHNLECQGDFQRFMNRQGDRYGYKKSWEALQQIAASYQNGSDDGIRATYRKISRNNKKNIEDLLTYTELKKYRVRGQNREYSTLDDVWNYAVKISIAR
jgi:hypothetical protein